MVGYRRLVWRVRALVLMGLAWHAMEAVVALIAGFSAASASLIGFGADATVETMGGLVVMWRFSRSRALSPRAERAAQRLLAASYGLIAGYVAIESTGSLITAERPDGSAAGIVLAVAALLIMPRLRDAKARVGEQLGSSVVRREGVENMMCAYLSVALLLGLGLNAAVGWWWADPAAGYVVAAIACAGGWRTWHAERTQQGPGICSAGGGC
jgi:divalent metal cation (Fe/Co/Zn/Cd) transporter